MHSLAVDAEDLGKPETSGDNLPTVRVLLCGFGLLLSGLGLLTFLGMYSHQEAGQVCEVPAGPYLGEEGDVGMVSTTNKFATEIGLGILRAGGNAVDAAAAVQFALAVAQPMSTGIGGGCFIMLHNASTGQVTAIDGREEAPEQFHGNMFCRNATCITDPDCVCGGVLPWSQRRPGGNSVGVPGVISAVDKMLREFGTMTLGETTAPAAQLARDGFPLYDFFIDTIEQRRELLSMWEESRQIYVDPNYTIKDTFTNPRLADTLELLGREGAQEFYQGAIAQDIVNIVRNSVNPETGKYGVMELSDLASYTAVHRTPTAANFTAHGQEYTVFGMPLPSTGGPSLAMMLQMAANMAMESYRAAKATTYHRLLDIQNIVYSDRNKYMGDADFVDVPTAGLMDEQYNVGRARELMQMWKPIPCPMEPGTPPGATPEAEELFKGAAYEEHGTTHFVIVDRHQNVVSFTTTIESNFGSGVAVRGFLLNNQLTDFDPVLVDPTTGQVAANGPEGGKMPRRTAALESERLTSGGKRPRSSMTPTIVTRNSDGKVVLGIGSPGGSRIIGAVFNSIVNLMYMDETLPNAIATHRVVGKNGKTSNVEPRMEGSAMADELTAIGFNLSFSSYVGHVHAVLIDHAAGPGQNLTKLYGVSDSTRLPSSLAKGLCGSDGLQECPKHPESLSGTSSPLQSQQFVA